MLSPKHSVQWILSIASLLFVAIVGYFLLVAQPFPMLHDYPEWMYQGNIAYSLLVDQEGDLATLFEWVPQPVPNALSQIAIAVLNFLVSPVMAGKIWLAVYLLLAAVTAVLVGRYHRQTVDQTIGPATSKTHHQHGGIVAFLFVVTIVFGPGFWNGYINFQFGLILFALFVATNARQSILAVLVFSLLLYFSHASVFAGFICYVVMLERLNERRVNVVVSLLPSLLLLMWYTSAKLQTGGGENVGLGSLPQWVQYKVYTLAKQGPFHNFIGPDGESVLANVDLLYKAGFLANFIVMALLGLWLLVILWGVIRGEWIRHVALDQTLNKGFFATIAILLVAWLVAGKSSFGVVNLGERFLIVALMLLLICVQCPRWLRAGWLLLGTIFGAITLVSLAVITQFDQKLYLVERTTDSTELTQFVDDIYKNSRHKYFNHRIFIYASLGQYLLDPAAFGQPPLVDHESSIVRAKPVVSE